MHILYVWDADYPWDIRVDKITSSLCKKNNVHIAARNLKCNNAYEQINNVHIHRLPCRNNTKLNYLLSFPLFCNPIWIRFLSHLIRTNNIDVVVVRDLPLAITAIWVAKKFKIPVVFDMAEDYLAMIRDIWRLKKFQGLNLIVRNPYLARFVERYVFKHIDYIVVVIDEAMKIVRNGGGNTDIVTIVSNTPVLMHESVNSVQKVQSETQKNQFSLIYTGGIQMGRGLQTVIQALPEIVKILPGFKFLVVGEGYARPQLQKMAAELAVDKYIEWTGWVDHSDMKKYIQYCDAGIIPHLVTDHVQTTIPNKIFDYMEYGLPVIATNAEPLMRIICDSQCGKVYDSGNSTDLVEKLSELANSDIPYGDNGRKAVHDKYNWSVDENRLFQLFDKIAASSKLAG